jgi:hypothetical protein
VTVPLNTADAPQASYVNDSQHRPYQPHSIENLDNSSQKPFHGQPHYPTPQDHSYGFYAHSHTQNAQEVSTNYAAVAPDHSGVPNFHKPAMIERRQTYPPANPKPHSLRVQQYVSPTQPAPNSVPTNAGNLPDNGIMQQRFQFWSYTSPNNHRDDATSAQRNFHDATLTCNATGHFESLSHVPPSSPSDYNPQQSHRAQNPPVSITQPSRSPSSTPSCANHSANFPFTFTQSPAPVLDPKARILESSLSNALSEMSFGSRSEDGSSSPSSTVGDSDSTTKPSRSTAKSSRSERSPRHRRKRPSKMHECPICQKLFPRPSGLAIHQNTHSGKKRTSTRRSVNHRHTDTRHADDPSHAF